MTNEEEQGATGGPSQESGKKVDKGQTSLIKKLSKYGIKEPTARLLVIENELDSMDGIGTLREEDITELGLTLGQRGLLRKLVVSLNQSTDNGEEKTGPVASTSMSVTEVKEQLADMESPGECVHLPVNAKTKINVPRPHEFIEGKKSFAEVSMSELMYGALLILENMIVK